MLYLQFASFFSRRNVKEVTEALPKKVRSGATTLKVTVEQLDPVAA